MTKEIKVGRLLENYFEGSITKKEMVNLVKIFKDDVERAKNEVIQEIRQDSSVPVEFFKNLNSFTIKVFDQTLQRAYNDRMCDNEMMRYVYSNVKRDLSRLACEKSFNTNH